MRRLLASIIIVALWVPAPTWAAVVYDSKDNNAVFGGTSITTPGFTISGTDRAAIVSIIFSNNAVTGVSCSVGGTAGTLITGTDSGTAHTKRTMMFGVIAPPTGSRSASCSWTGASDGMIGVITATGVDQTTAFSGGAYATTTSATSQSVSITSSNGDLTTSAVYGNTSATTNQTEKWQQYVTVRGDVGPGTGTTTHTWTDSLGNIVVVGANFLQVAAVGAAMQPSQGFLGAIQ